MKDELHLVLGAAGVSGLAVLEELKKRGLKSRAVIRQKSLEGYECVRADLLDSHQAEVVIREATHVYVCVGITYSTSVWEREWPILIQNVVRACEISESKLIFLDNIYMYGPSPLLVPFDETHSRSPSSKKGKVRKEVANIVWNAMTHNRIKAIIGRAADFYGPKVKNSALYPAFIENFLLNKTPQSIAPLRVRHTYAYVPDLGRALVDLSQEESCYGDIWHLPVGDPITIEELSILLNKILSTDLKVSHLPTFMRKILSLFISPLGELDEMMYQFNSDYVMSFEKFKKKFPKFRTTGYEEGLKATIQSFKNNG